jgi:hypothetical protein
VHDSKTYSPGEFENRSSWSNGCLDCHKITTLKITKSAILKEIALKVNWRPRSRSLLFLYIFEEQISLKLTEYKSCFGWVEGESIRLCIS